MPSRSEEKGRAPKRKRKDCGAHQSEVTDSNRRTIIPTADCYFRRTGQCPNGDTLPKRHTPWEDGDRTHTRASSENAAGKSVRNLRKRCKGIS